MASQPSFKRVKDALTGLQGSGRQSVDISPLLEFIEKAEADSPFDGDLVKMSHEFELARMKLNQDGKLEEFRSVIDTAKVALSTSILVNGGATVALLALIGNLLAKAQPGSLPTPPSLVWALVSFAVGVLAGAIATGTTYSAQYCYHMEHKRLAVTFHASTVILVLGSYAAFVTGIVNSYRAFVT